MTEAAPDALAELLHDWHPPLAITIGCTTACLIYLRGFAVLRRTRPQIERWRAWSFTAGVAVLWLALASPLEVLADSLLTAHMVEHLLLMMVVPPLLWLGWPAVPLLRGLPAGLRRWTAAPLLRSSWLRAVLHRLSSGPVSWLAMNAALLLWHIPGAYDFALEHEAWHDVEHLSFLAASMLFWRFVLQPWPSDRKPAGWAVPVSLALSDVVNTVLAALLAFTGHPVYAFYMDHQNGFGLDPLTDQQLGASVMWALGSIGFLVPMVVSVRDLIGKEP